MATRRSGRARAWLLWGGLSLVVLLLGMGAGLYFLAPPGVLEHYLAGGPFRPSGVQREMAPGPERETPAPGARRYRVAEGDTLWAIARSGKLVDSPWEWRTILVQNRDKIDYAFVSQETGEWKIAVETGRELTVQPEAGPPRRGSEGEKYAIQLLSLPGDRLGQALDVVKFLLAAGHYAYLYRTEVDGEQVYRIRAGFYESRHHARKAAEHLLAQDAPDVLTREYWVVKPSQAELRGEHLEFGALRTHPWVIELPPRGTHGEALRDFRRASGLAEFVYIAQRASATPESGARYVYHTRLGFFATEDAAYEVLEANRDEVPQLADARIVTVDNFAEALPGQQLQTQAPGS